MSLILQWLESLADKIEITDQCLRNVSPFSKCDLCIQVCDDKALELANGKIVVNVSDCTACGKCMTTCPADAIEGLVPVREVVKDSLIYDEKTQAPSVREWLYYYHKGVRLVVVSEEQVRDNWQESLNEANNYLTQMNKSELRLTTEIPQKEEQGYTRRQLFQQLSKESKSVVMKGLTPAKWRFNNTAFSLNKAFPDWSFYEVDIDEEKCNLCEICFKICPQKVFSIADGKLQIDHSKCTGCMICTDVCKEDAVVFEQKIQPNRIDTMELYEHKCPSCRTTMKQWTEEAEQCFICKNKRNTFRF